MRGTFREQKIHKDLKLTLLKMKTLKMECTLYETEEKPPKDEQFRLG